jgi:hypothetical protein
MKLMLVMCVLMLFWISFHIIPQALDQVLRHLIDRIGQLLFITITVVIALALNNSSVYFWVLYYIFFLITAKSLNVKGICIK